MASTASFGSLSVALANAITYLTRPLIEFYSATQIIKLQLALEANLTTQFEASWIPSDPLRGSGRRCLTFSPSCAPPRPIYNACKSASIDWSKWMTALGGVEFDLSLTLAVSPSASPPWAARPGSSSQFGRKKHPRPRHALPLPSWARQSHSKSSLLMETRTRSSSPCSPMRFGNPPG